MLFWFATHCVAQCTRLFARLYGRKWEKWKNVPLWVCLQVGDRRRVHAGGARLGSRSRICDPFPKPYVGLAALGGLLLGVHARPL